MFKILVAEDDAELRQLFCRVLTRHGFQPIGAADGVEALQVLERDYIDLIVSDIMMPQLDGYALVRGLRDSGNTIPVLMITARDGFQDMQFGFLAGADDYLVKPFEMKELMARINAVLRRSEIPDDTKKKLVFDKLEINLDSYELFRGFISGLYAGNYDISHVFIDNLCKTIGREVDKDTENFLNWLDAFGEKNNIKFTVTISADLSLATDGMQKFL